MANHTGTDWYIEEETGLILCNEDGKSSPTVIANVGKDGGVTPKPLKELMTNAHLIAKSPKMLETIKELIDCYFTTAYFTDTDRVSTAWSNAKKIDDALIDYGLFALGNRDLAQDSNAKRAELVKALKKHLRTLGYRSASVVQEAERAAMEMARDWIKKHPLAGTTETEYYLIDIEEFESELLGEKK